MRHLRRQQGVTFVELLVTLAIAAVLAVAAMPSFQDYVANSRLREGGHVLYAQTLFAQSEAIKRNAVVRMTIDGPQVMVTDRSDPDAPVELKSTFLSEGVSAPTASIEFGGEGRPIGFASVSIDLTLASLDCSTEIRCPGLRVDGGGAVRLCSDHTTHCD